MKKDLKSFAQQTNTQLIVGGILLLFIVGDGLVFLLMGPSAAVMGLLCLGGGMIPILIIYLVFVLIDWIVKNAHSKE